MLAFLPILVLVMGAVVIFIMRQIRPTIGYAWLTAVVSVLIAWVIMLVYRWQAPEKIVFENWFSIGDVHLNLTFQYQSVSWAYAFALVSVLLAVMFTSPVRLIAFRNPGEWVIDLLIGAAGLTAVIAHNLLAMVLTWTLVDIVEIIILINSAQEERMSRQAAASMAARFFGTMALVWAMVFSEIRGIDVDFAQLDPQIALILLVAAGLRLGVFPLFVPFTKEVPIRRGLGSLIRLISPALSLVLLARLSDFVMSTEWAIILSAFAVLAALYGAVMWLSASSELMGRPYWIISLAGMAVACVVRAKSAASVSWGAVMILLGALLFLYSYRRRYFYSLMIFGFLGASGLPFSPSASGWSGLVVLPFNLLDILFIAAQVILLLGYLKHAFREEPLPVGVERWMAAVFPLGLLFLIAAQWILGYDQLLVSIREGIWWAGVLSVALALLIYFLAYRVFPRVIAREKARLSPVLQAVQPLSGVVSLDFVYQLMTLLAKGIQLVVQAVTNILEGEGAILWAILLLMLLMSILQGQGGV
ncbi:MAG: hypothetical protein JW750_03555 [Anaerolineaceae bacterium]|nr:hypothetical protein [Anaerolineaceae bacterium]